jgi:hypothetical protein
VLLAGGAAIVAHSAGLSAADTFSPIASVDAGFAPDLEARLDKAVADKRVWNQHGLVVLHGNRLVLERYFKARVRRAALVRSVASHSGPTQSTIYGRAQRAS